MAKRDKLLPCPFCGLTPGGFDKVQDGGYIIGCHCGANGPVAESEEDARDGWNQRAPSEEGRVPRRCYSGRTCNHVVRCPSTGEAIKDIRANLGSGKPARMPSLAAAEGAARWVSELTGRTFVAEEVRHA